MLNCLDLRGRSITTYIAGRAAEALHTLAEGEVLELHTDDDRAIDNDLRAWCAATGTGLDATKHDGDGVRYLLTKHHADPCLRRSLALVVSDAGLEELLSPLGFALAAALEGMQVSVYFQGPAVRVLTAGFRPGLHGWARPFSAFARRGLEQAGHVSPQQKLAELHRFGARFYACGPSMRRFGVREQDLLHHDVVIAEYLTFAQILATADVSLYA